MKKNWIPYQIDLNSLPLRVKWIFIGNKTFTEPFFHETTSKCRVFEENQNPIYSSLEELISQSTTFEYLEPTCFIFHVSRCGSTLLTQLLSIDPQNIVVSEPPILDDALRGLDFSASRVDEETQNLAIKAVVNHLGQRRFEQQNNYIIKLDSWHIFYYDKLRKLYPDTPFIFSFRRPDEVIRSQVRECGMHAAPGVIQPQLFEFNLEEILLLERPVYVAKVLEKYFEHYLEIIDKDKNTLFINYAEGTLTILDKIEEFLKLKIEPSIKQKMVDRTQFHSKRPNTVFEEKPLNDVSPDYQKKVLEMYEILSKK
ncbi:MAG: hypothetical protein MUF45_03515 [Spirosomaceae bacterium]|jgi:hypothetical protein|nr:hypothetical protein [Spirosomataceae bacterium]